MSRTVPTALANHMKEPATTLCALLKITPKRADVAVFGITTLDNDVTYDDGTGSLTYRARRGYTAFDLDTKADLSVDSSEASGLLAEYPSDGVTAEGIARGDYDCARFVQYVVNYQDLTMGHTILNGGQVGQVTMLNDITCNIELRSLSQILKQISIIEVTSITCRAQFGDERCKLPLRWYPATVASVGAESDRTFTLGSQPGGGGVVDSSGAAAVSDVPFFTGDGTTVAAQLLDTSGNPVTSGFVVSDIKIDGVALGGGDYTVGLTGIVTFATAPVTASTATWDGSVPITPDGFFVPGVVEWLTGANAGRQNEIEEYDSHTFAITLVIPTAQTIVAGDTLQVRRDCDKSKTMCIAYTNLDNMRAEPELPRADGTQLQTPNG